MKKIAVVFALVFVFAGCVNDADVLVIGDRFFVIQIQDIFMNRHDYLGRTIQYEGVFRTIHWFETGNDYHVVVRYMFTCCSLEPIGLEVLLPGGMEPFPDDVWVEVTGVLEEHGEQGRFLRLRASSLIEKAERGLEIVEWGL